MLKKFYQTGRWLTMLVCLLLGILSLPSTVRAFDTIAINEENFPDAALRDALKEIAIHTTYNEEEIFPGTVSLNYSWRQI